MEAIASIFTSLPPMLLVSEFVAKHFGAVLVFIGVVGEGVEIVLKFICENPSRTFARRLEFIGGIFWIVLVVGLWMEFSEAAKSDVEVAQAEKDAAASVKTAAAARKEAGQANERAAEFELAAAKINKVAEELRSNNLVLQIKLQNRTVNITNLQNFILTSSEL